MRNNHFLTLITTDIDPASEKVLSTYHKIENFVWIDKRQTIEGISLKNTSDEYNIIKMFTAINDTIGTDQLNKFFNLKTSYLTRAYLAPKQDFIYVSQQLATYHHINFSPQFKEFNEGNWRKLEDSIRNNFRNKISITTGSCNVLNLPNDQGDLKPITLDKSIVPDYFYKNVQVDDKMYMFFAFNQPTINSEVQKRFETFCHDACETERYGWLDENLKKSSVRKSVANGYLLCCSLSKFHKKYRDPCLSSGSSSYKKIQRNFLIIIVLIYFIKFCIFE